MVLLYLKEVELIYHSLRSIYMEEKKFETEDTETEMIVRVD